MTKTPGAHFPTNCFFVSGLGKCHDGRVVALQQGAGAFARGASDPKQICSWKEVVPSGIFKKVICKKIAERNGGTVETC